MSKLRADEGGGSGRAFDEEQGGFGRIGRIGIDGSTGHWGWYGDEAEGF